MDAGKLAAETEVLDQLALAEEVAADPDLADLPRSVGLGLHADLGAAPLP